ncbi:hypothetical protein PIB30_028133 [Stylosanthes scabra]|uniref:Uncharacterized protein n=1 Tax=Stylosanthes scabra TaxID=79078 RepID=A0ABU6VBR6_9FABA|nr:hypothetical protein [Stylosanthes scabra]
MKVYSDRAAARPNWRGRATLCLMTKFTSRVRARDGHGAGVPLRDLATLVIEHRNNSSNISQPSNSENLPSQPLSNPWGHIGTLFLCTNQEGREDVLNEEDVESLHGSLEEVEERNEAQVAEDVDQKVEDNCKEPKGMEIVHSISSKVNPSKLPSELQFEWVNLPNLNSIGPKHYALLEKDGQLGALDGVLNDAFMVSIPMHQARLDHALAWAKRDPRPNSTLGPPLHHA